MHHTTIHDCKLIDLRKISDPREDELQLETFLLWSACSARYMARLG